ncbi:hypothetical protein GCM10010467_23300 [Actinocorallia glomerata]|uniref:Uncharacterized protein n=2 Tax=Actinomycetes TaxID=1760 RepID=A0ABP6LXH9_9MICC
MRRDPADGAERPALRTEGRSAGAREPAAETQELRRAAGVPVRAPPERMGMAADGTAGGALW